MWIHYEGLHNHNKAKHNKIVCIFLGIYCNYLSVPRSQKNYVSKRDPSRLYFCRHVFYTEIYEIITPGKVITDAQDNWSLAACTDPNGRWLTLEKQDISRYFAGQLWGHRLEKNVTRNHSKAQKIWRKHIHIWSHQSAYWWPSIAVCLEEIKCNDICVLHISNKHLCLESIWMQVKLDACMMKKCDIHAYDVLFVLPLFVILHSASLFFHV